MWRNVSPVLPPFCRITYCPSQGPSQARLVRLRLGVGKWPYWYQIVGNRGVFCRKGDVSRLVGEGRMEGGRLSWSLGGASLLRLDACLYSRETMWVERGEKEGWGLNLLLQLCPPTGLIILDCLFSTFCYHGDGLNRDYSDLRTWLAGCLSPLTCGVSAY